MHEELPQPGLDKHITGGGVDLLGGHARADRVNGRALRPLKYRILLGDIVTGLSDAVGAGGVGMISGLVAPPISTTTMSPTCSSRSEYP